MVCGSCRTFLIAPFLRRIYAVTDTVIALARFEGAEETVVAAPSVSAVLNFAPHPIGSPVKGSRQLAAEGLTAINYQLLALRCGQQPLVGNGFIRSACNGFIGSFRSG